MTNFLNTSKIIIFVIIFQVFSSCKEKELPFNGAVYKTKEGNFGYSILYKEKVFIKQDVIPTVQGNLKFNDSIDALKTLDLVLEKLNSGEKPTVSIEEIIKLNIKI